MKCSSESPAPPQETDRAADEEKGSRAIDVIGSLGLLGNILCWGSTPVLLRGLRGYIDGWTANGFRYPAVAVLYWFVLAAAYRKGHLNLRVVGLCLVPSLFALGGQVLWGLAPYYLPASVISFMVRAAMVWSILVAMICFADERALLKQPMFYLGLVLSIAGFIVLSISKGLTDAEVTLAGIFIILFCSIFFGLYAVSVRMFMRGLPPIVAFGVVSQVVSVGTFSAMWVMGNPADLLVMPTDGWLLLLASSLLGIAMGHFFLYTAVGRLGASITTGVQSVTPFITVALAAAFLGETLTGWEWLAGITMVMGALILFANQHVIKRAQLAEKLERVSKP